MSCHLTFQLIFSFKIEYGLLLTKLKIDETIVHFLNSETY